MNNSNPHYAIKWILDHCDDQHRYIISIDQHLGEEAKIRRQRLNLLVENNIIKNEKMTPEHLVHGTLTEKGIRIREKLNVK